MTRTKAGAGVYGLAFESEDGAKAVYKTIGVKMEMSVHMHIPSIAIV